MNTMNNSGFSNYNNIPKNNGAKPTKNYFQNNFSVGN